MQGKCLFTLRFSLGLETCSPITINHWQDGSVPPIVSPKAYLMLLQVQELGVGVGSHFSSENSYDEFPRLIFLSCLESPFILE